jgi:hypothetical protein
MATSFTAAAIFDALALLVVIAAVRLRQPAQPADTGAPAAAD